MASKDDILRAIRAHPVPPVDLPDLDQDWITYSDRRAQFAEMLKSVGGQCVFVESLDQINAALEQPLQTAQGKPVISLVPGIKGGNLDLNTISDAHDLESVEYAILPGQFGVAENAAIWVTDEGLKHRVLYFIVQHLVLVISSGEILDNMHQAYERLAFPGAGFGAFISGPSKTADIEQSLVIGAHGPRSLTVFCVVPPESQ